MAHQPPGTVTPDLAPWWGQIALNLQQCRASKPECVFKEVCHRECYYETGSDGTPRRKCVSEMQLLKLCPGRCGTAVTFVHSATDNCCLAYHGGEHTDFCTGMSGRQSVQLLVQRQARQKFHSNQSEQLSQITLHLLSRPNIEHYYNHTVSIALTC